MSLQKKIFLLFSIILFFSTNVWAATTKQFKNPDQIDIYLLPLYDFSELHSDTLAKYMSQDMNLRVKSYLRLPELPVATLPGTQQYIAEDVFVKTKQYINNIRKQDPDAYIIILTTADINSNSANFRFVFSQHHPDIQASVISLRRMMDYDEKGDALIDQKTILRLYKMMKRTIGEGYLGWKRSSHPLDLMYAPIMGLDDLDRITLQHQESPSLPNEELNETKPPQIQYF